MNELITSFTANLRRVLSHAAQLAAAQGKRSVEPVHLFFGLTNQAEAQVTGFTLNLSRQKTKKIKIPKSLTLSSTSKKILMHAASLAHSYHHPYIGTEHLFLSLLECDNQSIRNAVKSSSLDRVKIRQELDSILQNSSKILDLLDTLVPVDHTGVSAHHDHEEHGSKRARQKAVTALEYFGTDLCAIAQKTDPVIGRNQETDRLMQILSRRTKNNPVLIGAPGVGKTAIVEGLARRISEGSVPAPLKGKRIISLNLATLLAGSAFRGELEMRVKQLLDETREDPSVIIFIDEIHNLVGAGASNGSMDVANIFKPALARGELRCIGATTTQEYKRSIEEDPALERRFQPIYVEQPTVDDAVRILQGIAPSYEKFHGVSILPTAIRAAVVMSERYITDKWLPDKAIDLLDEACARARLTAPEQQEPVVLQTMQSRIAALSKEKEFQLYQEKDLARAQELHTEERDLKKLLNELSLPIPILVQPQNIAEIISASTGIPVGSLVADERTRLKELEQRLSKSIVGHANAKTIIANAVRRSKTGLTRKGRPVASFFFVGPSGVGKTELSKVLAHELFGKDSFVKLDMSEFSEGFTVSRLIGAPSGYVGYKEGGRLTESVRLRPSSLVLFDEIEKAHPKVLNLLLQVLDEGVLTDAAGKRVDFSNTIIILTSNGGNGFKFGQKGSLGFNEQGEQTPKTARQTSNQGLSDLFAQDLLNRLDAVIPFSSLTKEEIKTIISQNLADLKQRLSEQGISCSFKKNIHDAVFETWYNAEQGARSIRHAFEHEIESRLAEHLLSQDTDGSLVSVDIKKGAVVITSSRAK